MIYPTENNHRWIWLCEKEKQKILIYSRIGTYPYYIDDIFFENLTKSINRNYKIDLKKINITPVIRGVFLDDKNGNIGAVYVDLFSDSDCSNYIEEDIKIDIPTSDEECDLILSVFIFKKRFDYSSDYFSIHAEYQFEETKKEMFFTYR